MAAITVFTPGVASYASGTAAGTITSTGVVIDSGLLGALLAAAVTAQVTIGVGNPQVPEYSEQGSVIGATVTQAPVIIVPPTAAEQAAAPATVGQIGTGTGSGGPAVYS
jgi:hypothetical protein